MASHTRTHQQLIPRTIDGKTHLVTQELQLPNPPRDWDQIFLGAVTTIAAITGLGCVAWSTSSIGSLLSTIAPAPVAYAAAGAYDLLWMSCAVLEWLARYEPKQATGPRWAGLAFLAIAMAALITEGHLSHGTAAGIFGAFLSAGVKLLWVFITRRHAKRLDPLTQQWVDQEFAEAAGHLALASVQRRLTRSAAQLAAYRAAYPIGGPYEPGPDKPTGQPDTVSPDMLSAVREALALLGDATPEAIAEQIEQAGIPAPTGALSGQQDSSSAQILDLAGNPGSERIADTVRRAYRALGRDHEAVLAYVRRHHGPDVKADTVAKTLRRVAG